jgi:hypothetical protein
MTLTRTFRLTAADLPRVDTYHVASQDLWEGDDVEYSLQKADWEQQEAAASRSTRQLGAPGRTEESTE